MTKLEKPPATGANLDKCIAWAKLAGITVSNPRRKGEIRIEYPGLRPVTVHNGSKNSTRAMSVFLREVYDLKTRENTEPAEEWPPRDRTYTDRNTDRVYLNWYRAEWEAFRLNVLAWLLRERTPAPSFARTLKLNPTTLQGWIEGRSRISLSGLKKIAEAVGMKPEELLTRNEKLIGFLPDIPPDENIPRKFAEDYEAEREARRALEPEPAPYGGDAAQPKEIEEKRRVSELVQLNTRIPPETKERLAEKADAQGIKIQEIVETALRAYLSDDAAPAPAPAKQSNGHDWQGLFLALADKVRAMQGLEEILTADFRALMIADLTGAGRRFLVSYPSLKVPQVYRSSLDVAALTRQPCDKLLSMDPGDIVVDNARQTTIVRLKDTP